MDKETRLGELATDGDTRVAIGVTEGDGEEAEGERVPRRRAARCLGVLLVALFLLLLLLLLLLLFI